MSAESAIRHWDKEFKTSIELVTGDLFSGSTRPQAKLSLTHASPDTDIEWRVKLNLALKELATSGWKLDVEASPFSTATPKTLVALTAKGHLCAVGAGGSAGSKTCSNPNCGATMQRTRSTCSYCGWGLSNTKAQTEIAVFPMSEACFFRLENISIPKTLLTSTTVNSSTVSVLHLQLEITHYKEKKLRLPAPGSLPSLAPNLKVSQSSWKAVPLSTLSQVCIPKPFAEVEPPRP